MKRIIAIMFLILSLTATADSASDDLLHFTAHFGAAFAINTFTYGFMDTIGLDQGDSMVFSGFTTELLGICYIYSEQGSTASDLGRAVLYNSIGIGVSDLTLYMFHLKNTETTPSAYLAPMGEGGMAGVKIPFK